MAKKKLKKTKKPPARVKIAEEEYLERLIAATERAITSQGGSIDEFFSQQDSRLKKELQELRKKNAVR